MRFFNTIISSMAGKKTTVADLLVVVGNLQEGLDKQQEYYRQLRTAVGASVKDLQGNQARIEDGLAELLDDRLDARFSEFKKRLDGRLAALINHIERGPAAAESTASLAPSAPKQMLEWVQNNVIQMLIGDLQIKYLYKIVSNSYILRIHSQEMH